ncbi:MAG TPA: transglutaminase family protein [Terriglobales bacterium]|jgi:transglutaminase-like putative cysteine protease
MIYSVRHITTFRYEPAVRESVMEVHLQPRSEGRQRCLSFNLDITPSANIMLYRDFLGNTVHHFDIAEIHKEVKVAARSVVEVQATPVPAVHDSGSWEELDAITASEDHMEMLLPSVFAWPSELLKEFAGELQLKRSENPLGILLEIQSAIRANFSYVPNSTKVDSPIDDALQARKGVCQDFAHIMIALARKLQIPSRYVSGYLYHSETSEDRSPEGASHAWVEALVPGVGWMTFDPTNDIVGGDRHIRVAIGRDYSDVPPTRGVYKGDSESDLSVVVTVATSDMPPPEEMVPSLAVRSQPIQSQRRGPKSTLDQQQQQQQQ